MRLALCLLLLAPTTALAHGAASGYLELREGEPGRALVRWVGQGATPRLPQGCEQQALGEGLTALRCPSALAGRELGALGLGPALGEVVVWAELADGTRASHLLTASAPSWVLPHAGAPMAVASEYIGLGLRHILSGPDHLLFLLLLVLALRRPGAVLLAETGFTVSHSLAFSATALGWVRLPSAPVEACIALSLLLLALDVEPAGPALGARRGAALALVFGLVHGLGFASGLEAAGLPERAAAWALVGFGAGVELGQVAVLALAVLALAILRPGVRERVSWAGAWLAGVLSSYWLIARAVACLALD